MTSQSQFASSVVVLLLTSLCLCSAPQSWLYTLEQMKGSDSSVLTEDSVKMAAHFCLPVGEQGSWWRELVEL